MYSTNSTCHSRRFPTVLALVLMLTAGVLLPMVPAEAASCHIYAVTLQGTATLGSGGVVLSSQRFSVSQYAVWRDHGVKTHPVEFVLFPAHDLNATPQPGDILLMTNSAFAFNPGVASAQFDMARVAVAANGVVNFVLDSGMSLVLPPPNMLVVPGVGSVPGGLGGLGFLTGAGSQLAQLINGAPILSVSYLVPRTGTGSFYSPDGRWSTIAGALNLSASQVDNPNNQGQYQANFSGSYLQSVLCN